MLPPCDELLEELHILTYTKHKGVIKVMSNDDVKEKLKRSLDFLSSLMLTFAPISALFASDALMEAFQ